MDVWGSLAPELEPGVPAWRHLVALALISVPVLLP